MKSKNLFTILFIFSVLILISFTTTSADLTHVGYISGIGAPNFLEEAGGLYVEGNYAYVGGRDDESITIFDISNPSDPVHVGVINGTGAPNYLSGVFQIVKDGNYIYCTSNWDDALVIIDVSDPFNPTLEGEIHGGGAPNYLNGPKGLVKDGNYVYIACRTERCLTIVDVSDTSNPTFVSYLPEGAPRFWQPEYVAKKGDYLYISAVYGINSVDVSNVSNPILVGYVDSDPLSECRGIEISGNYAYTALYWPTGLNVFDISNPLSMFLVGSLQDATHLVDTKFLVLDGNRAYVTTDTQHSLVSIDISDPTSPSVIDSIAGIGAPNYLARPFDVAVANDYIFVTSRDDNALTIFSDPIPTPVPTGTPVMAPPPVVPVVPTEEPTPELTIEKTELTIIEETIESIKEEANNIFILISSFILKGAPFLILILGSYVGSSIASIYFDKMSNVINVLFYGTVGWIFVLIINLTNMINVIDTNILISFSIFTIIGTISYTLFALLREEKNK